MAGSSALAPALRSAMRVEAGGDAHRGPFSWAGRRVPCRRPRPRRPWRRWGRRTRRSLPACRWADTRAGRGDRNNGRRECARPRCARAGSGAGEQDPPGLVPAAREELLHVGVPGDEPQEPGSGVLDGRGKPSAVEAPARSTGVQDPAADARVPGAIEDGVQRLPEAQLRKDAAGQRAHAGSLLLLASSRRACSHSAQNGTPFRAAEVRAAACSFPVSARSAGEGRPADGAVSPRAGLRKTMILPSTTLPSSLVAYFGMLPPAACLSARSRGAVKAGPG